MHRISSQLTCSLALLLLSQLAQAQKSIITIESWRVDAGRTWNEKILPVFESAHPDIDVQFLPTRMDRNVNYDERLNNRFNNGTAGDIIVCRPFDRSLAHFQKGHLASIKDKVDLSPFSDVARTAWSTDKGDDVFCVPMASVIHGFMYNKKIFSELGLSAPKTEKDFFKTLEKIRNDGRYIPLAIGTKDAWESVAMGLNNVGPTFWKGEQGRQGLIDGKAKFTDKGFVKAFEHMFEWKKYLANGFQAQTYNDSRNMFAQSRAAIYPTGSWDIPHFQVDEKLELGVFPPPKESARSDCYISDHTDIGIGMNAASTNKEATLKFLNWVGTAEFAELFTNAFPGFFSLSDHSIDVNNSLARDFLAMRESCSSTIRVAQQILGRGDVPLSQVLDKLTPRVISGSMSAKAAAREAQQNIDKWISAEAEE